MNILFICNEYPPGKSGGIGSVTKSLARALVKQGHQIFVAGLYIPGFGQSDYFEDEGVKVWRKRLSVDTGLIKNNYSFRDKFILKILDKSGLRNYSTGKAFKKFNQFILALIEQYKIDIVEWPDFNEYFSFLHKSSVMSSLPVPLVVKFHGTNSYIQRQMGEPVDEASYSLEKIHIFRADALSSVSRNTAMDYQSLYEIKRDIQILYNSIDIPAYSYSENNSKTIIFTGTLAKLKGIHSLLRAWNLVNEKHPDAILRIFGKGSIHSLSGLLNPDSRKTVRFEGFAAREELYQAFSHSSGAIFPSYTECFAIAPLEAMAVGCPVIYTRRASGPELIENGINGVLIDPDNIQEIAEAMSVFIESPLKRDLFSKKGRQTIEKRFDILDSAKDHISFYSATISHHKKNRLNND
jgi:glycosyltransferase involved in cell wall biosynthesis